MDREQKRLSPACPFKRLNNPLIRSFTHSHYPLALSHTTLIPIQTHLMQLSTHGNQEKEKWKRGEARGRKEEDRSLPHISLSSKLREVASLFPTLALPLSSVPLSSPMRGSYERSGDAKNLGLPTEEVIKFN